MRILKIFFIICITLIIDIASKGYMSAWLGDKAISLINDVITLRIVHNTGVAFSLPIHGFLLQSITVILIGALITYFLKYEYQKQSHLLDIGYSLILGGAISHAYERVVFGRVVDFIAVKYFAVLNFADIFISIGFLCIIFYYYRYGRDN